MQLQTFVLHDLDKFQATSLKSQYSRYKTNGLIIRLNPEPGDSDDQAAGGAPQVIPSSFVNVLYKQYLLLFSPQVQQILFNFFVDAPLLLTTSNISYRFFFLHKCHKYCHLHSYADAYDINFGICRIDIRLSF